MLTSLEISTELFEFKLVWQIQEQVYTKSVEQGVRPLDMDGKMWAFPNRDTPTHVIGHMRRSLNAR